MIAGYRPHEQAPEIKRFSRFAVMNVWSYCVEPTHRQRTKLFQGQTSAWEVVRGDYNRGFSAVTAANKGRSKLINEGTSTSGRGFPDRRGER